MAGDPEDRGSGAYALGVADGSYAWYLRAAIRARRFYRWSESLVIVFSAAIPAAVALRREDPWIPALLGAVVVAVSGLRAVFHWQDNYLRFSAAREAVEAERRLYHTASAPYDDPGTRDQVLVAAVSRIEQQEMTAWVRIAAEKPKSG